MTCAPVPAIALRPRLARPDQLVAPAWLAQAQLSPSRLLFEVGCGERTAFERAHIPGARYLDTSELEQTPLYNKVPDADLLRLLLGHGIGHDSTVILYGRNVLAAARAAHLLLYAGVRDVRLLDGGYGAWCGAGLSSQSGPAPPCVPVAAFGALFPGRPDYLTDLPQARRLLECDEAALVSIRTWSEHTGLTSGYSYIAARGDIPGARWGRAGRDGDVNSMSHFQYPDGRMRGAAHITAAWQEQGIDAASRCAFYCGTGWRASLAFYYAWLMGWERISVYDGGWYEWSLAQAPAIVPIC